MYTKEEYVEDYYETDMEPYLEYIDKKLQEGQLSIYLKGVSYEQAPYLVHKITVALRVAGWTVEKCGLSTQRDDAGQFYLRVS